MRERRLRTQVREFQGCLGSLNDLDRRYLTLRAGLDGPPQSRGQAARQLGISRSDARVVERHGLRELRFACGAGTSGGSAQNIALGAPHMRQLQDASLLIATGGATPAPLVDQRQLAGEQHGVKGVHASSPPTAGGPRAVQTSVSRPLATASSEGIGAGAISLIAVLTLMTALGLVALRGRAVLNARSRAAQMSAALPVLPRPAQPPAPPLSLPEREEPVLTPPPPSPAVERARELQRAVAPPRSEVAPPQPAPAHRQGYRRAAMIASGVISVAARELMRRRGRR